MIPDDKRESIISSSPGDLYRHDSNPIEEPAKRGRCRSDATTIAARTQGRQLKRRSDRSSMDRETPTSVTLPGQYLPQPVLTVQDYCLRGRDQQVLQSGSVARADIRDSPWSVSAAACANCTGLLSQRTGPTSPTIGFGSTGRHPGRDQQVLQSGSVARADIRDSPWSVSAAACANCTGLLSQGRPTIGFGSGPTSVTLPGQYQPQPVLTVQDYCLRGRPTIGFGSTGRHPGRDQQVLQSGSVARADIRDSPWSVSAAACANCTGLLSQRTGPTSPTIGFGSTGRHPGRDQQVLQSGSVARADIRDSPWSVSAAACANCTGLLSQRTGPTSPTIGFGSTGRHP
ncbi:hypothetical protein J6590_054524 [Homalodisca vitripennis]|nr:hypothetical protein J6590_054524 [Homalodisca vitripennis]